MTSILMLVAVSCLALGFYLGRLAEKPLATTCPRCQQQRLFYCRGCGHHFDEEDQAIDPREFERMTLPAFRTDGVDT